MHEYLKAVGFSDINKQDMKKLLDDVMENATFIDNTIGSDGTEVIQMKKNYGENIGIAVCGTYNEDGDFSFEYYYPYFDGTGISSREKVETQRFSDREAYAVVCDDINVGVTLIYYMQNICEYLKETKNKRIETMNVGTTLAALSVEGMILLPVKKTEKSKNFSKKKNNERNNLIAAAKAGDEDAIESLTLEDIDTYSILSRRVMREDILSIVDTYFMPYGVESDQYSIMGEILNYYHTTNTLTGEKIYILTVDTNGLTYDVCINEKNLYGQPEIGRRFKGNIWMQGKLNFDM
ncbi:MAG: DUF3881 family protein [Lachnospiraceae bacterium]|nr:DUF3881 family protein [Lachnospiraceae bacterium]